MCREIDYLEAHKMFLWEKFKLEKDVERSKWWPGGNYKRENLPEFILMMERDEFEKWYEDYDNK